LSLHLLYQRFDTIKSTLVSYSSREVLVMLNLAVDLNALLTHCYAPLSGGSGHLL
jgi:hypothetical protein